MEIQQGFRRNDRFFCLFQLESLDLRYVSAFLLITSKSLFLLEGPLDFQSCGQEILTFEFSDFSSVLGGG